jgi:hypothetical protein
MLPMPFSRRRRERKALRVARLLVALDDVAGERRARVPRRSRVSLGSARA